MNKLMGFYELKQSSLPSVSWQEYTGQEILPEGFLWTLRIAVYKGKDIGLSRYVGITTKEANEKLIELYRKYKAIGMVVYYPFFIAQKSGTLSISQRQWVIEAVAGDLWHLVAESKVDVTMVKNNEKLWQVTGQNHFLTKGEINEIEKCIPLVQSTFRNLIMEGKTLLLEWSFACDSNIKGQAIGSPYLIFYEVRSI